VILAIEWLMRMERRTILGGGVFALTLLALLCIPRHLPLSASPPTPVPANFHARLEQGTLLLRGSLPDAAARDRILERARTTYNPAHVNVLDQLNNFSGRRGFGSNLSALVRQSSRIPNFNCFEERT